MIVAFFESIKYVGHLVPVALLRIYLGYYFFNLAVQNYYSDYLTRPHLASLVSEWLPHNKLPDWYRLIVENQISTQWQAVAYFIVIVQFITGISYLIGYLVRPVSFINALLILSFMPLVPSSQDFIYKLLCALFLTLGVLGAGRCLGLDYFFFKRHRGLWW